MKDRGKSRKAHRGKAAENAAGKKHGKSVGKRGKAERQPDHTALERESSTLTSTTDEKPVRGRPFTSDDPRRNTTTPGPGRPTDKFKKWCAKVIADPRTKRAVRRVLQNPRHKAQTSMWKGVAAHAHGQPTAHVDMTHKVTLEDLLSASHEGEKE